jgi:hypothetical protein
MPADDPSLEEKEAPIRALDEEDIAFLKNYGLGPYAATIKKAEQDVKDILKRVNDIAGIKESDTGLAPPSRWDLVSDKQMMQEEHPLQVARCTKIINPNTDEAKYVINVKQVRARLRARNWGLRPGALPGQRGRAAAAQAAAAGALAAAATAGAAAPAGRTSGRAGGGRRAPAAAALRAQEQPRRPAAAAAPAARAPSCPPPPTPPRAPAADRQVCGGPGRQGGAHRH